jgi:hypothetical protein
LLLQPVYPNFCQRREAFCLPAALDRFVLKKGQDFFFFFFFFLRFFFSCFCCAGSSCFSLCLLRTGFVGLLGAKTNRFFLFFIFFRPGECLCSSVVCWRLALPTLSKFADLRVLI